MWGGNGLKWKFSLQTISGLTCKERERERSHPEPFDFAPFDFAVRQRDRIAPREITGKPRAQITPLTSPRSHRPRIALHRLHWDRNWEMVGFWWIWPDLMNFFWLGLFLCLSIEKWYYIFVASWENVRNKKKMCFLYYFQQHNQTLENILQSIF